MLQKCSPCQNHVTDWMVLSTVCDGFCSALGRPWFKNYPLSWLGCSSSSSFPFDSAWLRIPDFGPSLYPHLQQRKCSIMNSIPAVTCVNYFTECALIFPLVIISSSFGILYLCWGREVTNIWDHISQRLKFFATWLHRNKTQSCFSQ